MKTVTNETINEDRLQQTGFSEEQILRLKELRTSYPLIELVQSIRELNELAFLKWQYQTGRITS